MSWFFKAGLLASFFSLLFGCGFSPVYSGGPGAKVKQDLSMVAIRSIPNRVGQRLRNYLINIINPNGRPAAPKYFLSVSLQESKQTLAIQKTEIATRANLFFIAKFSLSQRGQAGPLLSEQTSSMTSYNILTSEFATLVAERDARDRAVREMSIEIANQLALFLASRISHTRFGKTSGAP